MTRRISGVWGYAAAAYDVIDHVSRQCVDERWRSGVDVVLLHSGRLNATAAGPFDRSRRARPTDRPTRPDPGLGPGPGRLSPGCDINRRQYVLGRRPHVTDAA